MNISEEVKTFIKDSVDVQALVVSLGFKTTRSTSSEVRAPCIIHGGDNPTAFSMRLETKKWKCFTKKCEISQSGRVENDVIALVMRVSNLPFLDSLQFLADFAGLGIDVRKVELDISPGYYQKRDIDRFVKRSLRLSKPFRPASKLKEEAVLTYKQARDTYFIGQGFSANTLNVFEVGSAINRWGIPCATIPVRDDLGHLMGMSMRRTDNNDEPRYLLDYEFAKDKVLYNLSGAKQSGQDYLIIVEGFKACWAVYEAGFPNVIACMGSVVTEGQANLLGSYNFTNGILILDGDEAGQAGIEKSFSRLSKVFQVTTAYLPEDISPDDFSRTELHEFINIYKKLL